jgi:hypothetical protein
VARLPLRPVCSESVQNVLSILEVGRKVVLSAMDSQPGLLLSRYALEPMGLHSGAGRAVLRAIG